MRGTYGLARLVWRSSGYNVQLQEVQSARLARRTPADYDDPPPEFTSPRT